MKKYLLNSLLGAVLFGSISYVSSRAHISSYYHKIIAFLWALPLTFFAFILMFSDKGKTVVSDFAKHSLIGTFITMFMAILTLILIYFNVKLSIIVLTMLIIGLGSTVGYFYFELYKI